MDKQITVTDSVVGFVPITRCSCGSTSFQEANINGETIFICKNCGSVYFKVK